MTTKRSKKTAGKKTTTRSRNRASANSAPPQGGVTIEQALEGLATCLAFCNGETSVAAKATEKFAVGKAILADITRGHLVIVPASAIQKNPAEPAK